MLYSIRELARLSGVSTRTLRYYEEIDLLLPHSKEQTGIRFYGEREVDRLQQILFYKERGLELKQIKEILERDDLDILADLEEHLLALEAKKARMEVLIANLQKTIQTYKGDYQMTDMEKFEGLKDRLLQENEETYGSESRKHYSEKAVQLAQQAFAKLDRASYQKWTELDQTIKDKLAHAVAENLAISSPEGREIVQLHKDWLQILDQHYSAAKHKGIAALYTADERFTSYYDKDKTGSSAFLHRAVDYWAEKI